MVPTNLTREQTSTKTLTDNNALQYKMQNSAQLQHPIRCILFLLKSHLKHCMIHSSYTELHIRSFAPTNDCQHCAPRIMHALLST
jgi:hypothetical protein